LWPQYEHGFPEFCQVPAPRIDRNIVSTMLDLMPAPRLIFQQWDKHGTCSGLSATASFDTVRNARALVKIPAQFVDPQDMLTVATGEGEGAVATAEPGHPRVAASVAWDIGRLSGVRICVGKGFRFRACPDIDARACRRDKVVMPPMRPGSAALAQ